MDEQPTGYHQYEDGYHLSLKFKMSYLPSCFALWVKFSADYMQKYFSYFSKKDLAFHANCLLIFMKCQILFSVRNKKNIISLSSAEYDHSMVYDVKMSYLHIY